MSANLLQSPAGIWLAIQCRMIPGVSRALVRLKHEGMPASVVSWPDDSAASDRMNAALEQCLSSAAPVISSETAAPDGADERALIVACPIHQGDRQTGAVALAMSPAAGVDQPRAVIQLLTWGTAWLDYLCRQESTLTVARLRAVVDAAAASLEQDSSEAAAAAAATQLSRALGCDRATIAFLHHDRPRIVAMSDAASVDRRTRLARDIQAAMDEAVSQGSTIRYPPPAEVAGWTVEAHNCLAFRQQVASVLTVPLTARGQIVGVICLERRDGPEFDAVSVEVAESAAMLVGPVLAGKRHEDRGLLARLRDAARNGLTRLVGSRRPWVKAVALAVAALLTWLSFASGVHRVSADAVLEGAVHRALVAPVDSYVAQASARAGDLVSAGEVLATLQSEDLTLERRRWQGEVDERVREHRRAVADMDRSAASILEARIGKARARVGLIDAQLERTRIVAPIDGVVVKGDLSHSLGAPVQRGQVLFEVAPMDRYQVVLHVPESRIADLAPGQRGVMALTAMPGRRFEFVVEQVIGVAGVRDGRNVFRVEARLEDIGESLRPGMHGVGKIEVAERRLLWIWGHELTDRVGLWAWAHLP